MDFVKSIRRVQNWKKVLASAGLEAVPPAIFERIPQPTEEKEIQAKSRIQRSARDLLHEQLYYGSSYESSYEDISNICDSVNCLGGVVLADNTLEAPQLVGVRFFQGRNQMSPKVYRYRNYKRMAGVGDLVVVMVGSHFKVVEVVDLSTASVLWQAATKDICAVIK